MKLVSYQGKEGARVAAMVEGGYVDLHQADPRIPVSLKELLALGTEGLALARLAAQRGTKIPEVRLLAPIADPQKIIGVGLNYADHAQETGAKVGAEPVIFNKFPTTVRATGDPIVLPAVSSQVDFEAELVAVIGRPCRNVVQSEAASYVAGYMCGHDVSARDWQKGKPGLQWLLGKSFDSFAPCGPYLMTADEVGDPGALSIQLRLNGKVMQKSNTDQLIFSVPFLVSYLSQVTTLLPGDLIFTGTPSGVGVARDPQVFLRPGDVVEVEIEKLGILINPVVAPLA